MEEKHYSLPLNHLMNPPLSGLMTVRKLPLQAIEMEATMSSLWMLMEEVQKNFLRTRQMSFLQHSLKMIIISISLPRYKILQKVHSSLHHH